MTEKGGSSTQVRLNETVHQTIGVPIMEQEPVQPGTYATRANLAPLDTIKTRYAR